nr:aminotransferase class V-fold PLP-dependent enzyme [Candidatus Sigynarchaeota archaeon]
KRSRANVSFMLVDDTFLDHHWPNRHDVINLNNASEGTPPISALDAITTYFKNQVEGRVSIKEIVSMLDDVKLKLALLMGGEPKDFAFMPNTTEAINAAVHVITYPPGSNVVLCDLEFPANFIPWQNLRQFNDVEVRVVRNVNGSVPLEAFAEKVDTKTRAIAVSHVQFCNGFKSDLPTLSKLAHDHGACMVVDVIQSVGVIDFDAENTGADFIAGQATKWLLGPIGAGFLYVKPDLQQALHPRYAGWWGVDDVENFTFKEHMLAPDARKFQVGSPAIGCYHGLRAALDVLLQVPGSVRERRAMDAANHLRKRLDEARIKQVDFPAERRSPIVACEPPDVNGAFKRLVARRILCSIREGRLRVSPHFYNTKGDIDRLVDTLTSL